MCSGLLKYLIPFAAVSHVACGSKPVETYLVRDGTPFAVLLQQQKYVPTNHNGATNESWVNGHKDSWWGCEDKNFTGYEVWTTEGKLGPATCHDLADGGKCVNWVNSSEVLALCPLSCLICDPDGYKNPQEGPPCYDSIITGVRFKNGPQASCHNLARYCKHPTLAYHVQAACRQTCGLCEAHVGHLEGHCEDLEPHEEPEFRVAGQVASCPDLMDFCGGSTEAYLVRHKCPKTCGACPQPTTTPVHRFEGMKANPDSSNGGEFSAACDRRRRWGFCSTRRRRNF